MDSLKARFEAFQRSRAGLFVKKLLDDQAPNLAALLAWGTLSAILPLLLGVLSLAGLILSDQQTLDRVYGAVLSALPGEVARPVTGVLDSMRQGSAAPAGIVAIVLLLVNGSSFFSNMASVFDQAYHVNGRMFLLERLIGLGMLVVTTALLVVSTFAAGLAGLASNIPGALPIGPLLAEVLSWSIQIVSVFILFLLLYRVLPNAKQTWRAVIPGTLLSTVLLLLISELFPLYLTLFPPNHAYALFGVFLVFTFWLYLLGIVFVLGAELNAFLEQPARSVALAEATAAAERGRAQFDGQTGRVTAEASGQPRSDQSQTEQRRHTGVAGHLLGLAGLVVAALLLRAGQATEGGGHRVAA